MKIWSHNNYTIYDYLELESTNDLAMQLLNNNNLKHNEIILARKQTIGRGRYGKRWVSPSGNLYFSLIIDKKDNLATMSNLAFLSIVALGNTLIKLDNNINIQYKWPNDLIKDNKKIAGILLESSKFNSIIIGIGINIVSYPKDIEYDAGKLGIKIRIEDLLTKIIDNFDILYNKWIDFGFTPIKNQWIEKAYNLNKVTCVNLNNKKITGIFQDIDDQGNLVLRLDDGSLKLISSGEVYI